jgi:hypothetical protein
MERRMRVATIAAVAAMVVLVLAASSGPVEVWTTPSSDGGGAVVDTESPPSTDAPQPEQESRRELPGWVDSLSRAIGVLAAVLAITGALFALRYLRMPVIRGRHRVRRRQAVGSALPAEDQREVTVDLDAARAALAGGAPRNAIVACWMQLERDAADAGVPRQPFDTSTEYVERVIGASSVDPAPIGELAALFREARFSRHALSDDHRVRAVSALERVATALRPVAEAPR